MININKSIKLIHIKTILSELKKMTLKDMSTFEKHAGSMAWVVALGLLTWNVNTTNNLQMTAIKTEIAVVNLNERVKSSFDIDKSMADRINIIEVKMIKFESKYHNLEK